MKNGTFSLGQNDLGRVVMIKSGDGGLRISSHDDGGRIDIQLSEKQASDLKGMLE